MAVSNHEVFNYSVHQNIESNEDEPTLALKLLLMLT